MNLESYIDYVRLPGLLETAKNCFDNDPNDWLSIKSMIVNLKEYDREMVEYLKQHPDTSIDWHHVNLYPEQDATTNPVLRAKFQPIVDYIKTMKNILDVILIFNGPNSVIPPHRHPEDLDRDRVYRILLGIFVPPNTSISNDGKDISDLNMFVVDGSKSHSGYNNSDQWWVQLIISVNNV
jgi:hypothetical protein